MTVEELLIEEKIKFKQSPADFVVHCLNPEHDDTNPSMRIDKITGIYNCFSCGFKGNIFKLFDKPQMCITKSCVSSADSKIPKEKVNGINL